MDKQEKEDRYIANMIWGDRGRRANLELNTPAMKPSEFYEKYWKIKDSEGNMVSPPPLRDYEKDLLDWKCTEHDQTIWCCFKNGEHFIHSKRIPEM